MEVGEKCPNDGTVSPWPRQLQASDSLCRFCRFLAIQPLHGSLWMGIWVCWQPLFIRFCMLSSSLPVAAIERTQGKRTIEVSCC